MQGVDEKQKEKKEKKKEKKGRHEGSKMSLQRKGIGVGITKSCDANG